MNGRHLERLVYNIPNIQTTFLGVFPDHKLPPYKIPPEKLLVVNIQGEHWASIFIPKESLAEYFDPLGMIPSPAVELFFQRQDINYIFNSRNIQGPYSNSCGHYCIYFTALRSFGVSFQDILKTFTKSYYQNDNIVQNFADTLE